MTTTELATVPTGSALALRADQDWWNDKQIAALRQMGIDRANNGDLAVFMHVAQKTGLDPFARQIYMIERAGKQTIQTGIDGFRLIARRAAERLSEVIEYADTQWCGDDGVWTDVWLQTGPPAAAKTTVLRNGKSFSAVALFREYSQTNRDGKPVAMWAKMPANQIAKCSEALALRKAYPQDLSGIYTDDEMAQADRPTRQIPATSSGSGRERIAAVLDQPGPETAPADDDREPVDGELVDDPRPGDPDSLKLDLRSQLAKKMFAVMGDAGILDAGQHEYLTKVLGRPIESRKDLTEADAKLVIDATEDALANPWGDQ